MQTKYRLHRTHQRKFVDGVEQKGVESKWSKEPKLVEGGVGNGIEVFKRGGA